jgi:hypothetical protein
MKLVLVVISHAAEQTFFPSLTLRDNLFIRDTAVVAKAGHSPAPKDAFYLPTHPDLLQPDVGGRHFAS